MKTKNFLIAGFDFLRKLFSANSDDFKKPLEVAEKIEDENVLADNMIQNYRDRGVFLGPDFKGGHIIPKEFLLPKKEIVFEKKTVESEVVEVKKIRRILTYKIETKQGLILYEGKKISKFIEESGLDLDFTQEQVYRFANRHQATKIFKGKYFVSFKEVIK
jgi:hypothetical protein